MPLERTGRVSISAGSDTETGNPVCTGAAWNVAREAERLLRNSRLRPTQRPTSEGHWPRARSVQNEGFQPAIAPSCIPFTLELEECRLLAYDALWLL
jgi:hypothetical protein